MAVERCTVHTDYVCHVRRIDPPARHDQLTCEFCGHKIQAVAEHHGGVGFHGFRHYEWQHVDSGTADCWRKYTARPYDGWHATPLVEQAERDAYDRAEEAGEA